MDIHIPQEGMDSIDSQIPQGKSRESSADTVRTKPYFDKFPVAYLLAEFSNTFMKLIATVHLVINY